MPHKSSMSLVIAAGFASILLVACSNEAGSPAPPPDTRAADEAAIRANDADFVKAAQEKDLDKIVSLYLDDAVIFSAGAPAVIGKDNIRKFFEPITKGPATQFMFSDVKVDVARSGDIAEDRGSFQATGTNAKGKAVTQKGEYVLVWKKQADGSWKIAADTSANTK